MDFVQAINVERVFSAPSTRPASAAARRWRTHQPVLNLRTGRRGRCAAYHASKGAVRLMSKNDALIYAPDRIRVNSIHPSFIWTPMVEGFLGARAICARAVKPSMRFHPLGHVGEPDDIAWGAVYLASDEAKFMTVRTGDRWWPYRAVAPPQVGGGRCHPERRIGLGIDSRLRGRPETLPSPAFTP